MPPEYGHRLWNMFVGDEVRIEEKEVDGNSLQSCVSC